jgi:hypothetical protein
VATRPHISGSTISATVPRTNTSVQKTFFCIAEIVPFPDRCTNAKLPEPLRNAYNTQTCGVTLKTADV